MSDAEQRDQTEDDSEREAMEDLDVGDDADKVIGGLREDPCAGGQIQKK
jgi:hypothetical protein